MYKFVSGFACGLMGFAALALATPNSGSGERQSTHTSIEVSVNRAAKGDRAPINVARAVDTNTEARGKTGSVGDKYVPAKRPLPIIKREMPVGCESAVSIVVDDDLARTPSRCLS